MKKLQLLLLVFAMGVMVSCSQSNKKNDELVNEDEVAVNDEVVEEDDVRVVELDPDSKQYQICGMWQDINDEEYKMEITANKFKNYVDGGLNWDQDYVLAASDDLENIEEDENGSFILVYDGDGEIFYYCEVKELSENRLVVEHFVGGSAGNHLEFERE